MHGFGSARAVLASALSDESQLELYNRVMEKIDSLLNESDRNAWAFLLSDWQMDMITTDYVDKCLFRNGDKPLPMSALQSTPAKPTYSSDLSDAEFDELFHVLNNLARQEGDKVEWMNTLRCWCDGTETNSSVLDKIAHKRGSDA